MYTVTNVANDRTTTYTTLDDLHNGVAWCEMLGMDVIVHNNEGQVVHNTIIDGMLVNK